MTLQPGEMLLHDVNIVHGSEQNRYLPYRLFCFLHHAGSPVLPYCRWCMRAARRLLALSRAGESSDYEMEKGVVARWGVHP
jgi:hypothetical protein